MTRSSALGQLILARTREFIREPAAVFWTYGFPLMLALALGLAFRDRPVERIAVDVEADAPADALEKFEAALSADARIRLGKHPAEVARQRLRTAKTDLLVALHPHVPSGRYEYRFDPNRPESVLARAAVDAAILRADRGSALPIVESPTLEPGGRYIDFLIPGLLGTNLMGGGLWGIGFVTVDMRVRKLLKRLLATPMRKGDFLLSLIVSRLLFTVPEVLILLLFSWLLFGVRVAGDYLSLFVVVLAGAASFMGLGLLIASRAKTMEAVSGLMNLTMLPMYVLSGVFFASDRFPSAAQPIIQLLPLTALNDALRAVMLEGRPAWELGREFAILAGWGIISFGLALKWFRWS